MWKQDGISAPVTPVKLIDQLLASLTDPSSGWILHDDLRTMSNPAVVLRNNRGQGRDMYLYLRAQVSGANTRLSAWIHENWNATSHTGVNEVALGYRDIVTNTNVLVTAAVSPDMTATAFWLKQNSPLDPFVLGTIEPHRDTSGNPLNPSDDGTAWPQWGGLLGSDARLRMHAGLANDTAILPSTYTERNYGNWNKQVGGLWLRPPRTPTSKAYTLTLPGMFQAWWNSSQDDPDWAYMGYPRRRVAAWTSGGALTEGFPPLLWTSQMGADGVHELDWRGYFTASNILMSSGMGGAPEDAFEQSGATYRIVFASRGRAENGAMPVTLALRVD